MVLPQKFYNSTTESILLFQPVHVQTDVYGKNDNEIGTYRKNCSFVLLLLILLFDLSAFLILSIGETEGEEYCQVKECVKYSPGLLRKEQKKVCLWQTFDSLVFEVQQTLLLKDCFKCTQSLKLGATQFGCLASLGLHSTRYLKCVPCRT